jgi:hypothetical protein
VGGRSYRGLTRVARTRSRTVAIAVAVVAVVTVGLGFGVPGSSSAAGSQPGTSGAPTATCSRTAEVVFYAPRGRTRLLDGLDDYANPCVEYFITVPACSANLTRLRGEGCPPYPPEPTPAEQIRAHGPNFHAVAEFHYHGWNLASSSDANAKGVTFRKRMADAKYDVAAGDTWAINEIPSSIRTSDETRYIVRGLVAGLHLGGTQPDKKGAAFVINFGAATSNLTQYKTNLKSWLRSSAFWTTMANNVRWWAQETYSDCSAFCVSGSSLSTLDSQLRAYLEHPLRLSRATGAPADVATARSFLGRTYMPTGTAFWRSSVYGNTARLDMTQMKRLLRLQVYAMRGGVRLGFAWNESSADMTAAEALDLAHTIGNALNSAYNPAATANVCYTPAACSPVLGGATFFGWPGFGTW